MGCACKDCKEVTLFKGSDGVGIQHIEFSNCVNCPDTFTIFLTDGTTYTSPDLSGTQGPAGANGTNAFKFVKDFNSSFDGGISTITRAELESCANVPNGCLFNNVTPGFTNLQVQVWLRLNDPTPSGNWFLADSTNSSITINPTTGAITCTLTGGSLSVLVRMVVIA